ncbi:hypothetical protein Halru_2538 [Halovivax ruber XH-70]|uniref:MarR family transcriptional regulator n=1 Tax=Halovivax ruber (strain DSM 18193 / JCM 13892 / XH-70) TaxID=797302 RepID=L0IEB6_HALRX|nr:DUF6432 family protein [Halovivax ruber]AGB17119.1 hypothetical protein Halru_2538 [Halovivax ruber XH-70]
MRVKREYRDRDETQVTILDALVDRNEDGMTVFELRAAVSIDIDRLETALANLNDDDLIVVENSASETVIKPAPRVVPEPGADESDGSIVEWVRERFPF